MLVAILLITWDIKMNFVNNLKMFKLGYGFANEQIKNTSNPASTLKYLIDIVFKNAAWECKDEHYIKGVRFFLFLYFRK